MPTKKKKAVKEPKTIPIDPAKKDAFLRRVMIWKVMGEMFPEGWEGLGIAIGLDVELKELKGKAKKAMMRAMILQVIMQDLTEIGGLDWEKATY